MNGFEREQHTEMRPNPCFVRSKTFGVEGRLIENFNNCDQCQIQEKILERTIVQGKICRRDILKEAGAGRKSKHYQ